MPTPTIIAYFRNIAWFTKIVQISTPLFLLMGIAVALSRTPLPVDEIVLGDKILHAAAFFCFAVLLDIAWNKPFWLWIFLPLTAYGILIELLQGMTSWRSMDIADIIADMVGILLYWCLAYWLLKPALSK